MGAGASLSYKNGIKSRKHFDKNVYPDIEHLLETLSLSQNHAFKLFKAYASIGGNSLSEFHRYFGIQNSAFTGRVFALFDTDQSEQLDLHEFIIGVWNFLTYDVYLMSKFAFGIFDIDSTGELSIEECDAMIRMIHKTETADPDCIRIIAEQCAPNGKVSFQSFAALANRHSALMAPAFEVQQKIRQKLNDEHYWVLRAHNRRKTFGTKEIHEAKGWKLALQTLLSEG